MIIVTGHLLVRPGTRDDYLLTCADVVRAARRAPGCLDFAISADLVDDDRVDVLEVWRSQSELAAFRGAGIGEEQGAMLADVAVREYDATPR